MQNVPGMRLAKVIVVITAVACLFVGYDRIAVTRCGTPGVKQTRIKAQAIADRWQHAAEATGQCPSPSDLGKDDVDAWSQPFQLSCTPGIPNRILVTSLGRDGIPGTADDIRAEAPEDIRNEPQRDAGHEDGGAADADEAPLGELDSTTRKEKIELLEHLLPPLGWRLARSPKDDQLTAIVKKHLKEAGRPLPDNPRFVIVKRDGGWGVFVMDFEAFLRGERPHFDTYRIGYRHGRLELLYAEVGL